MGSSAIVFLTTDSGYGMVSHMDTDKAKQIWLRKAMPRLKHRAKKLKAYTGQLLPAGLGFDLTPQDLEPLPDFCPVLGLELIYSGSLRDRGGSGATVDRKDSRLGYVKGNVWVISFAANIQKGRMPPEKFQELLRLYREAEALPGFFSLSPEEQEAILKPRREIYRLIDNFNASFPRSVPTIKRTNFPSWINTYGDEKPDPVEVLRDELNAELV